MPVLLTTAAVSLIFLAGNKPEGRASLLDPPSVRRAIEALPESERRSRSLEIVRNFDRIIREQQANAAVVLDAYAEQVAANAPAASLIETLRPVDEAFARLMKELRGEREALLETLTAEEWDAVFG